MHLRPVFLLTCLIFILMVTGCTGQQTGPQPAAPVAPEQTLSGSLSAAAHPFPDELSGTWNLVTLGTRGGTAVITPTREISLTFNPDGTLSGYDGCNNYFASANLTGTTTPSGTGLTLGPVGSSKKFCSAVADQEQQYFNILGKTSSYVVDGTRLILTAKTQDVLIYQRSGTQ
jgi:heat shock protein HslJ